MRPPHFPAHPPDPFSRSLQAHALAEDQRREAGRTVAALRSREASARRAAAERHRLGSEALARGDAPWGLSLLDAASHAEASAADLARRREEAERRERDLASVERALREELFRAMGRFLAEIGAT